ncbi:tumor-associated calcium signal transducer 2-like [Conger conger]|uniref:tumor-associated calcium signal transducer 2-like n=1 Tax=Conger conger TaxID=82655 RepID=UPI002A59C243|nr:tumor-associated calcium signal transducer 2-like [Conger conger]
MKLKTLCMISALIFESTVAVVAVPDDECNDEFPARENCEFDEVCEDAFCKHNEYVTCYMNRCGTCEAVFRGYDNFTVDCNQLTPKCRLMHLEMLNKRRTGTILPGGRLEIEYDPECDGNGMFKPKQCDDDSNLCWCVDSAGVRVTDKTGDDPKCDRLVRVHQLVFKLVKEYTLDTTQILEISIQELSQEVSIRLTENGTKDPVDVATVAYYIERDLKINKFGLEVDGRSLEVERDSIKVLFFDNEPPRMNMKTISPGFAAIVIVIALAILTGIAVFVVVRRRAEQEKKRFQFEVIEGQGQDDYHMAQRETMAYFVM